MWHRLTSGSIKVFNQNVDADTAEEIVTMAYDNGMCLYYNSDVLFYFSTMKLL